MKKKFLSKIIKINFLKVFMIQIRNSIIFILKYQQYKNIKDIKMIKVQMLI